MLACQNGNVLTVSTLLWASEQALGAQYTSYINEAASNGSTALIFACKFGHQTTTRVLLEEGASPLPANRRGETAVHVAAVRGHVTCLELVLDSPVRDMAAGAPIAAMAPVRDHAGETRFIDAHDRAGFTALHLAVLAHSHAATAALVQRGATLDCPVLRGMERLPYLCGGSTPLHIAAAQGDCQTCIVLLDGQWRHPGLELRRVRNMLGLTPLNCALLGGHHEVVRVLVDPGRRASGGGGGGGANFAALTRNIPQTSFPESLRGHMLAVLQRAALLLQLRQIAGQWSAAGVAQPSDTAVTALPGLDSLSLTQVKRLQRLLRRQDASLRDVLYGLETTLHGRGGPGTSNDGESSEEESNGAAREGGRVGVPAGMGLRSETIARADVFSSRAREGQLFGALPGSHGRLSRRERARARRRGNNVGRENISGGGGSDRGGSSNAIAEAERQYNELENALAEISQPSATDGVASHDRGAQEAGPGPAQVGVEARDGSGDQATVSVSSEGTAEGTAGGTDGTTTAASSADSQQAEQHGKGCSSLDIKVSENTEDCSICMDSLAEVAFLPCAHSLCFHCACRLCVRGTDNTTCPFCRRDVESVTVLAGARSAPAKPKTAPAGEAQQPTTNA